MVTLQDEVVHLVSIDAPLWSEENEDLFTTIMLTKPQFDPNYIPLAKIPSEIDWFQYQLEHPSVTMEEFALWWIQTHMA